MRLEGKVVLVAGAASGMGAACADVARAHGAALHLVDLDEDALTSVAGRLGASHQACDLADPSSGELVVAACVERHGRIDGLVNAAAVMQTVPLLQISPEDFDRMFAVNVRGAFFLQQAAARAMVAAGRGGSIVNFASTAGRVGRPMASHYAASKAAVMSFSRSAALALAGDAVRVNAICPGLIETPMVEAIRQQRSTLLGTTPDAVQERWLETIPMRRLGEPSEVAETVAFLLSDAAPYLTGESLGVTGGTDGA